MKKLLLATLVAASIGLPAHAVEQPQSSGAASAGSSHASSMSEGEVRRVDKDAKKITIRHGPLRNLDMPAMTMVFQVKEPAMLDQVKAGDRIRFEADKVGGAFTVTKMERAD